MCWEHIWWCLCSWMVTRQSWHPCQGANLWSNLVHVPMAITRISCTYFFWSYNKPAGKKQNAVVTIETVIGTGNMFTRYYPRRNQSFPLIWHIYGTKEPNSPHCQNFPPDTKLSLLVCFTDSFFPSCNKLNLPSELNDKYCLVTKLQMTKSWTTETCKQVKARC